MSGSRRGAEIAETVFRTSRRRTRPLRPGTGRARLLPSRKRPDVRCADRLSRSFAKGRAGIAALADHDFVVVHVEATDEASHEGEVEEKIKALERIDEHIVGPLHDHLRSQGDYRLVLSPDHPTFLRTKTHSHGYVPIAACGHGIEADPAETYDDVTAAASSLVFEKGCDLMPWLLK